MPQVRKNVVYGLHDGEGNVFYVGKTSHLKKRMAAYRQGRTHGNKGLAAKLATHGVNVEILHDSPADINAAEFDEIESRAGLVNLITDRAQILNRAKSDKPWVVAGCKCPSEQYRMVMRNTFKTSMPDIHSHLKRMNDQERLQAEWRFASFMTRSSGVSRWVEGMPHASA